MVTWWDGEMAGPCTARTSAIHRLRKRQLPLLCFVAGPMSQVGKWGGILIYDEEKVKKRSEGVVLQNTPADRPPLCNGSCRDEGRGTEMLRLQARRVQII